MSTEHQILTEQKSRSFRNVISFRRDFPTFCITCVAAEKSCLLGALQGYVQGGVHGSELGWKRTILSTGLEKHYFRFILEVVTAAKFSKQKKYEEERV